MKPVLTIFFDGLKPESLAEMPFLRSFSHQYRMKTILGYSIACHASMYSGVYPDQHGLWFLWEYSRETSPFRWVRPLGGLRPFDRLPTRLLLHAITAQFVKRSSFWGIPRIVHLPIRYWPYFDVAERVFWNEPHYLRDHPTVFELLSAAGIRYEAPGLEKTRRPTSERVASHAFTEIQPWTYLFIGDVDHISHEFVQESRESRAHLRELDRLVERQYEEYSRRVRDFHFFAFSDHGHIKVTRRMDLYAFFRQNGDDLNRYLHVVDANYARFWFRGDKERRNVERVLATLDGGFVLSPAQLEHYHVEMHNNRNGDLIYYFDAGNIFTKTIFGFGRTIKSMHGYLPDHPESDGMLVSNQPIAAGQDPELVDIAPSLLNLFDLPVPSYMKGRPLWQHHE